MQHGQPHDSQGRIAFRLRIGVTGRRALGDHNAAASRVQAVLRYCQATFELSPSTPMLLVGVSPLAPGADQLVADEVLKHAGAVVEAPLPLEMKAYFEQSFDATFGGQDQISEEVAAQFAQAKAHYMELIASPRVRTVPPRPGLEADAAFEEVGRRVVDNCDVLLAIWDGNSKNRNGDAEASRKGGTAATVEYAHARGRTVIVIPAEGGGEIDYGDFAPELVKVAKQIDRYNRERVRDREFRARLRSRRMSIAVAGEEARCEPVNVDRFSTWASPYFVRADILAQRFQRRYNHFFLGVFLSSAAAVSVAAVQALFLKHHPGYAGIEVGLMAGVLALVIIGHNSEVHELWIDSRLLAERFRAAFFLAIAGFGASDAKYSDSFRPGSEAVWLNRALGDFFLNMPSGSPDEVEVESVRRLLKDGWLQEQITYYQDRKDEFEKRHWRLGRAIEGLFVLTILAASFHAVSGLLHLHDAAVLRVSVSDSLVLLAISVPAVGAAVSGLRVQREFQRIARRYGQLLPALRSALSKIDDSRDFPQLLAAAEYAQAIMLGESEYWSTVVRLHELEVEV